MIKDSGDRTQFASGAVRDMHEGKGRCDLLPLREVASILQDPVLLLMAQGVEHKDPSRFSSAFHMFAKYHQWDEYTAMLEVAKHYEDGCRKYGERNWQRGIPCHSFLDSAIRHYLKHCRGDEDERHDRAFVWNILGLMWTIRNKPELNDLWQDE